MKFQKIRRIFSAALSATIVLTSNCCHAVLCGYELNMSGYESDARKYFGVERKFYTLNSDEGEVKDILLKRVSSRRFAASDQHIVGRMTSPIYNILSKYSDRSWIFDYEKYGDHQCPTEWNLISADAYNPCGTKKLMYVPVPEYFEDKPELLEQFRTVLLSEEPFRMAKKSTDDPPLTSLRNVFTPEIDYDDSSYKSLYFDLEYDFGSGAQYDHGRWLSATNCENAYETGTDAVLLDERLQPTRIKIRNRHCWVREYRLKVLPRVKKRKAEKKARKEKEYKAADREVKDNTATALTRSDCKSKTSAQHNVLPPFYAPTYLPTPSPFIATSQPSYSLPVQQNFSYSNVQMPFCGQQQPRQYGQVPNQSPQPVSFQPSYSMPVQQNFGYSNVQMPFYGQQQPRQYGQIPNQSSQPVSFQPSYSLPVQQNFGHLSAQAQFSGQQQTPYYK